MVLQQRAGTRLVARSDRDLTGCGDGEQQLVLGALQKTTLPHYVSNYFPAKGSLDQVHSPFLLHTPPDIILQLSAMFHDLHVPWPGAGADAVRELQRTVAFLDECTQTQRPCVYVGR